MYVFDTQTGELINQVKNKVFADTIDIPIVNQHYYCVLSEDQIGMIKLRRKEIFKKFEVEDLNNFIFHVSKDSEYVYLISEGETSAIWRMKSFDLLDDYYKFLGNVTNIHFLENDQMMGIFKNFECGDCIDSVNFSGRNAENVSSIVITTFPGGSSNHDNFVQKELFRSEVPIKFFQCNVSEDNVMQLVVVLNEATVKFCKYQLNHIEGDLEFTFIEIYEIFGKFSKQATLKEVNPLKKANTIEFFQSSLQVFSKKKYNYKNNEMFKMDQKPNDFVRSQTRRNTKFLKSKRNAECVLILKGLPNATVFCESILDSPTEDTYTFNVHFQYIDQYEKIKIKMEEGGLENELEVFKIMEIPNKKRNNKNKHNVLIYSQIKMILVSINSKTMEINIAKVIDQNVEKNTEIAYSESLKFFFVPNEEYLDIWDRTFTHKVYSVPLKNKIKGFKVLSEKETIFLYDNYR